jgi:hypothetical protein
MQRDREKRDENSAKNGIPDEFAAHVGIHPTLVTPKRSLKFELIWNLPPAQVTSGQRASQLVEFLFPLPDVAVRRPVRIHFILEDAGRGIHDPVPRIRAIEDSLE